MPRVAAWLALGSEFPLRALDGACAERGLERRDRALARALVGLEIRRRGTLVRIVRAFTRRAPERELARHLHLGLVQLLYLDRVPPHAALSASVDAARETLGRTAASFVNAVLRAAQRALLPGRCGDPRRDLVDRALCFDRPILRDPARDRFAWGEDAFSIPAALLRRWTQRHGEERAFALARTFLDEPPLSLRVVRGTRSSLIEELVALGVEARAGSSESAILVPSEHTSTALESEAFRSGRVTVQGETASAAAELLCARPGERLLDLCAAPGGKTAILLAAGASVVACDVDRERLALAGETCARLGVERRLELVVSDGTRALAPGLFDGVLVDAPCSNTGVLGARAEARWRFGPDELASLVALQRRLLREGAERVRPGGRLVWSTCSLEPEENGELVQEFLAEHAEWSLEAEREAFPDYERGPIDGGCSARLARGG
jgi:16S rRNA (cytosine967-C5)-methyltransferase